MKVEVIILRVRLSVYVLGGKDQRDGGEEKMGRSQGDEGEKRVEVESAKTVYENIRNSREGLGPFPKQ